MGAKKGNLNAKKKNKTPQSLAASSKGIAALLTTQTTAKRRGRPSNSQQNTAVAGPSRMSQAATSTNTSAPMHIEIVESTGPGVREPVLPPPQDNTPMDIVKDDTGTDFELDDYEESSTEDGDGIQNNTNQQQSISASRSTTPASSRCETPASSTSVTPNVQNTKPEGTNRFYWWNHFTLVTAVNGEQLRQCNHFDVSYKHTGGTGNMALHMHKEHDNKVQLSQQIIDSHFKLRLPCQV